MPSEGFDPPTYYTEIRGGVSELPSHVGEAYPLPYMETENLPSDL